MSKILEHRPLILRSNRFLGSALVERGLVSSNDLEAANEKLLEVIQAGDIRGASLLNILTIELKVLDEAALIDSMVEMDEVSLVDLSTYDISKFKEMKVDIDLCWATFTFPFDRMENFAMLATSYYLSEPTKKFWLEHFNGDVIWYTTSILSIAKALERAEEEAAATPAAKESES
ncbi:MAG: hypothetical protein AAGA45_01745 [Verrucomicrobiota bacterium]